MPSSDDYIARGQALIEAQAAKRVAKRQRAALAQADCARRAAQDAAVTPANAASPSAGATIAAEPLSASDRLKQAMNSLAVAMLLAPHQDGGQQYTDPARSLDRLAALAPDGYREELAALAYTARTRRDIPNESRVASILRSIQATLVSKDETAGMASPPRTVKRYPLSDGTLPGLRLARRVAR